jgi:hypothetical protein
MVKKNIESFSVKRFREVHTHQAVKLCKGKRTTSAERGGSAGTQGRLHDQTTNLPQVYGKSGPKSGAR